MQINERQAELLHHEIVSLKERLADMTRDRDIAVSSIKFAKDEGMHCADEWRYKCEELLRAQRPDPGPPRPDDMGELARLTAIELRKRGIWAERSFPTTGDGYSVRVPYRYQEETRFTWYSMFGAIFDNLVPRECADEIQRQEAQRAKEWAGDLDG